MKELWLKILLFIAKRWSLFLGHEWSDVLNMRKDDPRYGSSDEWKVGTKKIVNKKGVTTSIKVTEESPDGDISISYLTADGGDDLQSRTNMTEIPGDDGNISANVLTRSGETASFKIAKHPMRTSGDH